MAVREVTLGEGLEQARESVGLTQDRLRTLFNHVTGKETTEKTFRSWLKGQPEPRIGDYNVIAQILNETFDQLGMPDRLPIILFAVDDGRGPRGGASRSTRITFFLPNGKAYMAWFRHHRLAPAETGSPDLALVG